MAKNRIEGDTHFSGSITMREIQLPAGTVSDSDVAAGAKIGQTKLEHQHRRGYAQESATNVADEARVIHVVAGATGEVTAFEIGAVVASTGGGLADVDLLVGGASILNAATPVQLTAATAAYGTVEGVIGTAAVANGNVIEVSIVGTVGGGTLAKGLFMSLTIAEDAE